MPSAPPRNPIPQLAKLDLVLETDHLRLQPLSQADVDDMFPIVSDPAFPKLMSWAAHTDKTQTREYVTTVEKEHALGSAIVWAIRYDGKTVGAIGLHDIEYAVRAWRVDRADLGYWLAPALWRKGLMTEAATAVVRCGFDQLALHKVTVSCFAQNDGSRRVIEKLGFRYVGRREDDVYRDGAWHAHLCYELTAPEWPDVHTTLRIDRKAVKGQ